MSPRNTIGFALASVMFLGCGSGSSNPAAAAAAITAGLSFGAGYTGTLTSSAMPAGSTTGPQVTPASSGMPTMITPGSALSIPIAWSGGAIGNLNIGFSTVSGNPPSYFSVAPSNTASTSMAAGSVTVPTTLGGAVCSNLANICHMIRCYEQVTLPDGSVVSKAQAQMMVLDCTMGKGCATTGPGNCVGPTTCGAKGGAFTTCCTTTNCSYTASDGTVYTCNGIGTSTACQTAAQQIATWCQSH